MEEKLNKIKIFCQDCHSELEVDAKEYYSLAGKNNALLPYICQDCLFECNLNAKVTGI